MDPLIRYKYPDASTSIVRNIGKALMLIPSFYYQVLHLMNKLQLPPPFINSDYEFDELLLPRTFSVDKYQLKSETSESELEDDYADHLTGTTDRIQKAKTLLQSLKRKRLLKSDNETKYTKTNPKCLSVISTPQPIHIQFDPIGTTVKKAIRLPDKLTLPTNQSSNYFDNSILTKNFDRMEQQPPSNVTKIETHTNDEAANSDSVTDEELNNRVTKEEMCELAPFKNYTLGVPSCRLYVKNIAKKVTESQLRRLFARFTFDSNRQLVDGFHVQLLTSGRMRGQAFVTYSSVEIAQQALNATNGLWIENKPIVVNYARPIINQD